MRKHLLRFLTVLLFVCLGACLFAACGDTEENPEGNTTETTYTLTYNANGGTGNDVTEQHKQGDSVTLKGANTFTYEGHTLIGWNDGTTDHALGGTFTMPAKNVTMKARWQTNGGSETPEKYTLNFTGDTASVDIVVDNEAESYDAGTVVTFSVTAKQGYTLVSVKNGESELTAQSGKYSVTLNANTTITVTARQEGGDEPQTYTLNFTGDTANVNIVVDNEAESYAAGTTVTFSVTAKQGYTLVSVKNGNAELTAQSGKYSVTLNANVTITITATQQGGSQDNRALSDFANATVNVFGASGIQIVIRAKATGYADAAAITSDLRLEIGNQQVTPSDVNAPAGDSEIWTIYFGMNSVPNVQAKTQLTLKGIQSNKTYENIAATADETTAKVGNTTYSLTLEEGKLYLNVASEQGGGDVEVDKEIKQTVAIEFYAGDFFYLYVSTEDLNWISENVKSVKVDGVQYAHNNNAGYLVDGDKIQIQVEIGAQDNADKNEWTLVWYDADGKAVAKTVATREFTPGGDEGDFEKGELVENADTSKALINSGKNDTPQDDGFMMWWVQGLDWNSGSIVTMTPDKDNIASAMQDGKISFSYTGGSMDYSVQLFYKNTNLDQHKEYVLSLDINLTEGESLTIRVNGKSVELTKGANHVEVKFEHWFDHDDSRQDWEKWMGNYGVDIQFPGTEFEGVTATNVGIEVSNVAWYTVKEAGGGEDPATKSLSFSNAHVEAADGKAYLVLTAASTLYTEDDLKSFVIFNNDKEITVDEAKSQLVANGESTLYFDITALTSVDSWYWMHLKINGENWDADANGNLKYEATIEKNQKVEAGNHRYNLELNGGTQLILVIEEVNVFYSAHLELVDGTVYYVLDANMEKYTEEQIRKSVLFDGDRTFNSVDEKFETISEGNGRFRLYFDITELTGNRFYPHIKLEGAGADGADISVGDVKCAFDVYKGTVTNGKTRYTMLTDYDMPCVELSTIPDNFYETTKVELISKENKAVLVLTGTYIGYDKDTLQGILDKLYIDLQNAPEAPEAVKDGRDQYAVYKGFPRTVTVEEGGTWKIELEVTMGLQDITYKDDTAAEWKDGAYLVHFGTKNDAGDGADLKVLDAENGQTVTVGDGNIVYTLRNYYGSGKASEYWGCIGLSIEDPSVVRKDAAIDYSTIKFEEEDGKVYLVIGGTNQNCEQADFKFDVENITGGRLNPEFSFETAEGRFTIKVDLTTVPGNAEYYMHLVILGSGAGNVATQTNEGYNVEKVDPYEIEIRNTGWGPWSWVLKVASKGGATLNFVKGEGAEGADPEVDLGELNDQGVYTVKLPENTYTAPANKYFRGWEVDEVVYFPGEQLDVKADAVVTLTAVWEEFEKIEQSGVVGVWGQENNHPYTLVDNTTIALTAEYTALDTVDEAAGPLNDATYFGVVVQVFDGSNWYFLRPDKAYAYVEGNDWKWGVAATNVSVTGSDIADAAAYNEARLSGTTKVDLALKSKTLTVKYAIMSADSEAYAFTFTVTGIQSDMLTVYFAKDGTDTEMKSSTAVAYAAISPDKTPITLTAVGYQPKLWTSDIRKGEKLVLSGNVQLTATSLEDWDGPLVALYKGAAAVGIMRLDHYVIGSNNNDTNPAFDVTSEGLHYVCAQTGAMAQGQTYALTLTIDWTTEDMILYTAKLGEDYTSAWTVTAMADNALADVYKLDLGGEDAVITITSLARTSVKPVIAPFKNGGEADAKANKDIWYWWFANGDGGCTVNVKDAKYDLERNVITLNYETTSGEVWWGMQLFYKNSTLEAGKSYKLTFDINFIGVDGETEYTMKVNGSAQKVHGGSNSVEVTYTEGDGASFSLQFGSDVDVEQATMITEANVEITNWKWEEAAVQPPVDSRGEQPTVEDQAKYAKGGQTGGALSAKEAINAGKDASQDDTVMLWWVKDEGWSCGTVVTMTTNKYESEVITLTYTGGDQTYSVQAFYKNTNLTDNTLYYVSVKLLSTKEMTLTVNGTSVVLKANEAQTVEVLFRNGGKTGDNNPMYGLDMQMPGMEEETTLTISEVKWYEAVQKPDAGTETKTIVPLEDDEFYGGNYLAIIVSKEDFDLLATADKVVINDDYTGDNWANKGFENVGPSGSGYKVNVRLSLETATPGEYVMNWVIGEQVIATYTYTVAAAA